MKNESNELRSMIRKHIQQELLNEEFSDRVKQDERYGLYLGIIRFIYKNPSEMPTGFQNTLINLIGDKYKNNIPKNLEKLLDNYTFVDE
jgi:hypothetical protein